MKSGPLGTRPLARLAVVSATVGALLLSVVGIADALDDDPVPSFTWTQGGNTVKVATTTAPVDFDGSVSSTDPIVSHGWEWTGDGSFDDAVTEDASNTFAAGSHSVQLRATDDEATPRTGTSAAQTILVDANDAPEASFTQSPTNPQTVQNITFTDTSTDPEDALLSGGETTIVTREWDLDDDDVYGEAGETGTTVGPVQFTDDDDPNEVKLKIVDEHGVEDVESKNIVVTNRAPNANPTVTDSSQPTGTAFAFSGSTSTDADGTISTYQWDYDYDGTFEVDETGASVNEAFASVGSHVVALRVTDDDGVSNTDTITVTAENRVPTASFTVTDLTPQVGQQITFNGAGSSDPESEALTYAWDLDGDGFDDGTSSSLDHTFTTNGSKTVRLRVRDPHVGGEDTHEVTFEVNAAPTAAFTVSDTTPQVGEDVTFNGAGSTDPEGNSLLYAWDKDGDGFDDGTSSSLVTSFPSHGSKTVRLRVQDGEGGDDIEQVTLTVNGAPAFDATPITNGTPVQNAGTSFTAHATDPNADPMTYVWDVLGVGDDNDGTGASANLVLPDDQSYTVRVTVSDGQGGQSVEEKTVTVDNQGPTAGFSQSPSPVIKGHQVTLTSTSADPDGSIAAGDVKWYFDADGVADATGTSVQRFFANDTTIRIEVEDDDGGTDDFTGTVDVAEGLPPAASFNWFPTAPLAGDTVNFTSTASDPDGPFDQSWDLDGDGVFGESGEVGESVSRVFSAAGSFTVALRAQDQEFPADTEFRTVTVAPRPAPPAPAPAAAPPPAPQPAPAATPAPPRLMSPFPIVRVRGRLVRGGRTRITLLSVEAPRGATVTVRCRGRGCPFKTKSQSARRSRVRVSGLRRSLRPRVRIELFIEQPNAIGKYTRFTIRRGRAPLRRDLCLRPGSKRPRTCPA